MKYTEKQKERIRKGNINGIGNANGERNKKPLRTTDGFEIYESKINYNHNYGIRRQGKSEKE